MSTLKAFFVGVLFTAWVLMVIEWNNKTSPIFHIPESSRLNLGTPTHEWEAAKTYLKCGGQRIVVHCDGTDAGFIIVERNE